MSKEKRVLIAVYGSLREGLHNHQLLVNAKYIGAFTSNPTFSMFDLGSFPAIVNKGNFTVEFEVYAVNKEQAKRVDNLEGFTGKNSDSWYKKGIIETPFGKAFYYYFDKDSNESMKKSDLVESGNWKDYYLTKI